MAPHLRLVRGRLVELAGELDMTDVFPGVAVVAHQPREPRTPFRGGEGGQGQLGPKAMGVNVGPEFSDQFVGRLELPEDVRPSSVPTGELRFPVALTGHAGHTPQRL